MIRLLTHKKQDLVMLLDAGGAGAHPPRSAFGSLMTTVHTVTTTIK